MMQFQLRNRYTVITSSLLATQSTKASTLLIWAIVGNADDKW